MLSDYSNTLIRFGSTLLIWRSFNKSINTSVWQVTIEITGCILIVCHTSRQVAVYWFANKSRHFLSITSRCSISVPRGYLPAFNRIDNDQQESNVLKTNIREILNKIFLWFDSHHDLIFTRICFSEWLNLYQILILIRRQFFCLSEIDQIPAWICYGLL